MLIAAILLLRRIALDHNELDDLVGYEGFRDGFILSARLIETASKTERGLHLEEAGAIMSHAIQYWKSIKIVHPAAHERRLMKKNIGRFFTPKKNFCAVCNLCKKRRM